MGQRSWPHLTKQVKKILCKTEIFVPHVVPGLSSNVGVIASSTSLPHDPSSTSSSPATEGSDDRAPRNWRDSPKPQSKNKKRDNNRASGDRFPRRSRMVRRVYRKSRRCRSTRTPQTFLMSQIPNGLQKWHPGSTVIFTHLPKDRNCEVCLRTKMTRALCRRRSGEAVPQAEKFGDLITTDHTVLNEENESRNNHRYAVVVSESRKSFFQ